MKNFIKAGNIVSHIATGAIVSGDMVVIGDLAGVASSTVANGESVEVALSGVYELPKSNSVEMFQGDSLYSTGGGALDKTDTGVFVGYCFEDQLAADETVKVKLK